MQFVYWCAACGNPDVIVENTKSGYSMGKGIVGAAVLGPVGAVAGLDGKDTVTYYCPKCGAKLNHCMPDIEVSLILNYLKEPELNRDMIERKHKQYPNMMLPKGWTERETAGASGEPEFEKLKKVLQNSDEYDCADDVYGYIREYGQLSSKQVWALKEKLKQDGLNKEAALFEAALHELTKPNGDNYKVKLKDGPNFDDTLYVAAKNSDEIFQWRLEANAQRKAYSEMPLDKYIELVKVLITNGPKTIEEIERIIQHNDPSINNDNPYMSHAVANAVCNKVKSADGRVKYDGKTIRIANTKLAEDELRLKAEERWRSGTGGKRIKENSRLFSTLQSKGRATYMELSDNQIVTPQTSAARTKILYDAGIFDMQRIDGKNYYMIKPEYRYWTREDISRWTKKDYLGEESIRETLDALKKNSGKSYFDIFPGARVLYDNMMYLESEGYARRTETEGEYIWEFIDKDAEARKVLTEEKDKLEIELEELKNEYAEKIPEWEEQIKVIRSRVFDGGELDSKVSDLEGKRAGLVTKLSSLGFFSLKEKKQVNAEIAECDKDLEKANADLESAKASFNSLIENEVSSYQGFIKNAKNNIATKTDKLKEVEDRLGKLNK